MRVRLTSAVRLLFLVVLCLPANRRPLHAQVAAGEITGTVKDQAGAVKQYRYGLSLGGTRPLPELFAAAGATFAFDAGTMSELVGLIEQTIGELEAV